MEMLVHSNYIMLNPDRGKLKEQGFRYNRVMSDAEEDFFSLRFPALQYNNSTTVEGEIIVDLKSGNVRIEAYSYGTRSNYPPFYQLVCSDVYEPIITKINQAFQRMFQKLGIEKVGAAYGN